MTPDEQKRRDYDEHDCAILNSAHADYVESLQKQLEFYKEQAKYWQDAYFEVTDRQVEKLQEGIDELKKEFESWAKSSS